MKVTTFRAFENTSIEDIEKLLKDKLGDKYEYESSRKANSLAEKLVNSTSANAITVIKNAYHRTVVSIETIDDSSLESGKRTTIYFSEASVAGWLSFLRKKAGLIGGLILGLIYGKSNEIYKEVEDVIKTNIKGEEEIFEVGLGAVFNK